MAAEVYRALLIGNSSFPDDPAGLPNLTGPYHDVNALRDALTDRDCGLFAAKDVTLLVDLPKQEITTSMERFLSGAGRDDRLLLYYSGHGLLDVNNHLYICARDTCTETLISTGIRNDEMDAMIQQSPARTFIVILDCCHSGRWKTRWKAGTRLPEKLKGTGRFIITSSEAGQLTADAKQADSPSPFTRHLAASLTTSTLAADDGSYVTLDAIYHYVWDQMASEGPQRPQRSFDDTVGVVRLARRPEPARHDIPKERPGRGELPQLHLSESLIKLPDVSADEVLPEEVIDVFGPTDWTIESDADWITVTRRSETAFAMTLRPQPGVSRGKVRVRSRAAEQTRTVRVVVRMLDREPPPLLSVDPAEVDFGSLSVGEPSPTRTVRLTNLGGGDLAAVARVKGGALKLRRRGSVLELTVDTSSAGELAGEVAVESAGGRAAVPVRARVQQGPVLVVEPQTIDLGQSSSFGSQESARHRITVRNAGSGELVWDYGQTGHFFRVDRDDHGLWVYSPFRNLLRQEGTIWVRSNGGEATVPVLAGRTDLPHPGAFNVAGRTDLLRPGAFNVAARTSAATLPWRLGPTADLTAEWRKQAQAAESRRASARAANPRFFADVRWWVWGAVFVLLTTSAAAAIGPLLRLAMGTWLGVHPPHVEGEPWVLPTAGILVGLHQVWVAAGWWRFDPATGWGAIFRRRALIALAVWLALAVSWTVALAGALHIPSGDPPRVAIQVFALGALLVAFVMAPGGRWRHPWLQVGADKSQNGYVAVAAHAGLALVVMVVAAVFAEPALLWVVEPYAIELPVAPAAWLVYLAAGAWTLTFALVAAEMTGRTREWRPLLNCGLLGGWSLPTVVGAVPLNLWAPWCAARLLGLIPVHFFGLAPYGLTVAGAFAVLTVILISSHGALGEELGPW